MANIRPFTMKRQEDFLALCDRFYELTNQKRMRWAMRFLLSVTPTDMLDRIFHDRTLIPAGMTREQVANGFLGVGGMPTWDEVRGAALIIVHMHDMGIKKALARYMPVRRPEDIGLLGPRRDNAGA